MKVLLCHAYYTQPGGEDRSFEEERELLRGHGHEVLEYVRKNEELSGVHPLIVATRTLWNSSATREISSLIRRERPDVLHITNTFPLISPAVCHTARRNGVAVVQALRNYRLLCANSYLMRDDRPCEDCIGRLVPWPAVAHRCYRNSAGASAIVAGMQTLHRVLGTWSRKVDAFFTLTRFARQKFVEAGLPAARIHVKHNSVSPNLGEGGGDGGYIVLVGRLSPEKGIATALEAWRRDRALPPLKVVGDGPLAPLVQAAAAADSRITWLGHLPTAEVYAAIGSATALLMPSLWYETFGRTIAEAFAAGTPVIASRLGSMAELVSDETGALFEPGNPADLAAAIRRIQAAPSERLATLRRQARAEYARCFTPERNYDSLVGIYEIARRSSDSQLRAIPSLEPAVV